MMHDERRLYQPNNISYNLVMLFLLLNTIHAIFTLQNMNLDFQLGIFVIVTIFITMLSFLAAVKILTYSLEWSYVTLGIGVLQCIRFLTSPKELDSKLTLYLAILILLSVVCIVASSVISIVVSRQRSRMVKALNQSKSSVQN